jgi:hypothetical protein
MTRGTLYYICSIPKQRMLQVIRSVEFNGDMYPEGHGNDVMNGLAELGIDMPDEFKKFVKKFDKENFNYQAEKYGYFKFYKDKKTSYFKSVGDEEGISAIIDGTASFKFRRKTDNILIDFPWFLSDWEFFKNGSNHPVYIFTKDLEMVKLYPMDTVALPFMRMRYSWFIKG